MESNQVIVAQHRLYIRNIELTPRRIQPEHFCSS